MDAVSRPKRGHVPRRIALPRWHDAASPEGFAKYQRASVVEAVRLHADPAHAEALEELERRCSRAIGMAMEWLRQHLHVRMTDDLTGKTDRQRLHAADLLLTPDSVAGLPAWTKGEGTSNRPPRSGAVPRPKVNLFAPENLGAPDVPKDPNAVRIAWGQRVERTDEATGERTESWGATHLDPKFQLQQLFLKVLPSAVLADVPSPLRAGIGQEVAQQLTSHLMLADSGAVAVAAFPTVEQRDPTARRRAWEQALDRVSRRASPFPYARARDVDPSKYREDDPRGDRLVNTDPHWKTVVATPEARRTPLLYVTGKAIRLYRRVWTPGHRGHTARGTYAALPVGKEVFDRAPPDVRARLAWWRKPAVLGELSPLTPGTPRLTKNAGVLLVPLSYGRKRTERKVLGALTRPLPIQWARVVHRTYRRGEQEERDKWFLQLTIGYAAPTAFPTRVLGIHFGLDDICYWALMEDRGSGTDPVPLEEGKWEGNPILAHGLSKKDELEWDQRKGRWVGGKVYGKALRGDTHHVVDRIIALAREKGVEGLHAGLGVERLRWVPKGQGSPEENKRFSAWNYGQLPTFLRYKAPTAAVRFITEVFPTRVDRQQDDAEQARRIARKTVQRLREQRRRAADAAQRRAAEVEVVGGNEPA